MDPRNYGFCGQSSHGTIAWMDKVSKVWQVAQVVGFNKVHVKVLVDAQAVEFSKVHV